MDPKENEVVVNEDAALDAELESTLNAIKTGNEPEPKAEVKTEDKVVDTKVEPTDTKVEDTSAPPKDKTEEYEFRVPNKGKFESDESYEKRIELMDLVKKRKLAKTDDQKKEFSEQIQTTKNQIRTLNGKDRFINPLNTSEVDDTKKEDEIDPALKADQERLKELGGVTKEDLQAVVQQERLATEVRNTLDLFIKRHDVLKDEDTREIFFDFVDSNYNWQNKSGKELMTVLELARENMFKPSESIEERVIKGANVAEKVNSMQFPGGTTVNKAALSPEVKKSVDELVATGMSEEKALELISE